MGRRRETGGRNHPLIPLHDLESGREGYSQRAAGCMLGDIDIWHTNTHTYTLSKSTHSKHGHGIFQAGALIFYKFLLSRSRRFTLLSSSITVRHLLLPSPLFMSSRFTLPPSSLLLFLTVYLSLIYVIYHYTAHAFITIEP